MRILNHATPGNSQRGGALVATLVTVSVLAVMAGAALTVNTANKNVIESARSRMRAIYLAEAGVAEALGTLYASGLNGDDPAGQYGDRKSPRTSEAGEFWSELFNNGDGTYTALSTAMVNGSERSLEVIVEVEEETIYDHAIFAGNSSGDNNYKMKFGGYGIEADDITGDIYSGGDILISGNVSVNGALRAAGKISGKTGEEDIVLPIPDIPGMDYSVNNDVDVAALFASGDAQWRSDDAGGSAWQMPEDSPAHIFRKSASDRTSASGNNGRDDYFLEDPYEPVRVDADYDGSDAFPITLSGTAGDPGVDTSDAVFFIDGNLWIHNIPTFSFKFVHENGESVNCTFVVRGNIYFSDNIFYDNPETDGVAFIAMKDGDVDNTGNIYFGDPVGGTLEHMDGFMYAENDFVDLNLSATGSKKVTVNGNMTAGNHVAIERSYRNSHSKLTVEFDDRIKTGKISMPGLPTHGSGGTEASAYSVVSWREVQLEHWINGGQQTSTSPGRDDGDYNKGGSDDSTSVDSGDSGGSTPGDTGSDGDTGGDTNTGGSSGQGSGSGNGGSGGGGSGWGGGGGRHDR